MIAYLKNIPSWLLTIILFIIIFSMYCINYIKKYKNTSKRILTFQNSIKPGDNIILSSGIYGTIVELDIKLAKVQIDKSTIIQVDRLCIASLQKQISQIDS